MHRSVSFCFITVAVAKTMSYTALHLEPMTQVRRAPVRSKYFLLPSIGMDVMFESRFVGCIKQKKEFKIHFVVISFCSVSFDHPLQSQQLISVAQIVNVGNLPVAQFVFEWK